VNLAIFDIDGTLTHTNEVDGLCFAYAWESCYSIRDLSTDWSAYKYSTDSGIFDEVFRARFDRAPSVTDRSQFIESFVTKLKSLAHMKPDLFSEVRGAAAMLTKLSETPNWKVSLATGAWRESAKTKLAAAKVNAETVPFACAEDDFDRKEIISHSWKRARETYHQSEFEKVIYIGDGLWDLRSSRELGIGFVGMHFLGNGDYFRLQNVNHILSSYEDFPAVLHALEGERGQTSPR
jgi:phosphoglycolate phosphatase-like HAD superfamily hydrolase